MARVSLSRPNYGLDFQVNKSSVGVLTNSLVFFKLFLLHPKVDHHAEGVAFCSLGGSLNCEVVPRRARI